MNSTSKKQIISELDSLPESKVHSLLDYLHFLKQDKNDYYPNDETKNALNEAKDTMQSYSSSDELFQDLEIDT